MYLGVGKAKMWDQVCGIISQKALVRYITPGGNRWSTLNTHADRVESTLLSAT